MKTMRWLAIIAAFFLAVIGSLIWYQYAQYEHGERRMSDLMEIRIACFTYAEDHAGQFPTDWQGVLSYSNQTMLHIYRRTSVNESIFLCPTRWADYQYFGGMSTASPPESILFYPVRRRPSATGSRALLVDCSVPWLSNAELSNRLEMTSSRSRVRSSGGLRREYWPALSCHPAQTAGAFEYTRSRNPKLLDFVEHTLVLCNEFRRRHAQPPLQKLHVKTICLCRSPRIFRRSGSSP